MIGRRHKKRHHRNPGGAMTLRGPLEGIKVRWKALSPKDVAVMTGGVFANYAIRTAIGRKFPQTQTGYKSYLVGVGGALALMMVPKVGANLFAGAIVEEALRAIMAYAMPGVKVLGEYLLTSNQPSAMSEFLEDNTARVAGEINLRDYLEVEQKPTVEELNIRM